jgi:hypothetical protein
MANMESGSTVKDNVTSVNVLEVTETELNSPVLLLKVLKSLLGWIVYFVADQANLN